jgi:arginase family enzyme
MRPRIQQNLTFVPLAWFVGALTNTTLSSIAAMAIAELNPVFDSPARTTAILGARLFLDCITVRL